MSHRSPDKSASGFSPGFRSKPSCTICSDSLALRVIASSSGSHPNSAARRRLTVSMFRLGGGADKERDESLLEVALTRHFSFLYWYHAAFLILGVGMLGLGAAGTFLAGRGGVADEADARRAMHRVRELKTK